MPQILYRSRYLVPVSSPVLDDSALVVENGRIVDIGSASTMLVRYPKCRHCDFGESIVLPAFVNAHTHLELSHYQQWAEQVGEAVDGNSDFVDWILRLIRIKIAHKLDLDHYKSSWQFGLQQGLASGTGLFGDILSVNGLAPTVAKKMPGCSFIEIIGQDPLRVNKQLYQLSHCLGAWPGSSWGAAPHAPYTISDELLKQCYRYTTCNHLRTTIHLAESSEEVEFLATSGGSIAEQLYPFVCWQQYLPLKAKLRPLQYVEQAGGLNSQTMLVHGVHLNQQEISRVASAGCSVVLCPRSNAKLQVGVAPAADYLRAGVDLALGTDSLASNDSLSLWDEMEFARNWFNGALSPEQLLRMCTLGGAIALYGNGSKGLNNGSKQVSAGQLAVGAPATFQVVQPDSLPCVDQLYEFLCNAQRGNEVKQVVIDGNIRYTKADSQDHKSVRDGMSCS
jgi:cytosine/adenosine deaminase-related metal-dependent hydrolase